MTKIERGSDHQRMAVRAVVFVLIAACSQSPLPTTAATSDLTTTTTSVTVTTHLAAPETSTAPGLGSGLVVSENPLERAAEIGLFAPDGEYVGPVGADGEPLILEPIYGYGDFSDDDWFGYDRTLVVARVARCMTDHGFAVDLHPDGSGFGWDRIPVEQNQLGQAVMWACREGLRLPPSRPRTRAEWEEDYAFQLALADCFRQHGYEIEEAPSLEAWIDAEGKIWSASDSLPIMAATPDGAFTVCPPSPPGGFGAWDPGDPITPWSGAENG